MSESAVLSVNHGSVSMESATGVVRPQENHPDSFSLQGHCSTLGRDDLFELVKESHSLSLSHAAGSVDADDENEDLTHSDVVSAVVSAGKIIGLLVPVEATSPSEGVWAGISQTRPSVAVPAEIIARC